MKLFSRLFALVLTLSVGSTLLAQEYGLASFYSDKFHGKETASGELYDRSKLTAAHKTHPFGTLLRVTRLDNKKSVTVRVNDRGPYITGRVVDVSRTAADRLGLVTDGTARVKVELVDRAEEKITEAEKPEPKPKPAPREEPKEEVKAEKKTEQVAEAKPEPKKEEKKATPVEEVMPPPSSTGTSVPLQPAKLVTPQNYSRYGLYQIELRKPELKGFGVQVASLTVYESVFKEVADLQGGWFDNIMVSIEPSEEGLNVYKIILGPFEERSAATNYLKNLKKKKGRDGFVVNLEDLNF